MRQNARSVLRGLLSIAERKTGILEPGIHIVFDSPQKMIRSNPGDFRFDGIARQDLVTANKGSFGQKRIQPAERVINQGPQPHHPKPVRVILIDRENKMERLDPLRGQLLEAVTFPALAKDIAEAPLRKIPQAGVGQAGRIAACPAGDIFLFKEKNIQPQPGRMRRDARADDAGTDDEELGRTDGH